MEQHTLNHLPHLPYLRQFLDKQILSANDGCLDLSSLIDTLKSLF